MISLLRKVPSLLTASAIRSHRPNFRQANHCMTTNVESNEQPTLENQTDNLPTTVETQPFYERGDDFDYEEYLGLFGSYLGIFLAYEIATKEEMHNHETVLVPIKEEELQDLNHRLDLLLERDAQYCKAKYCKKDPIDKKRDKNRREELPKSEMRMEARIQRNFEEGQVQP